MSDVPELRQGFEIFANWQTVIFCLSIYLIVYFVRSIVENWPKTKTFAAGWVWKTVLLPFSPIAVGLLLSVACKKFPWPMPVANALSAKLMYGAACGVGSGWMFARVRDWFGIAADNGNEAARKVASMMFCRPHSDRPPPTAFGPKKD